LRVDPQPYCGNNLKKARIIRDLAQSTCYGMIMKAPSRPGLHQFLTYRLHVLNKLSERGSGERYQAKLGITLPEARLIAAVGAFGPFSVMELARHANLDKSQASRAADALMRRGLMRRDASEDDGRLVLVSLTPEGRALYRRVMPVARKWHADFLSCLDERERNTLSLLLDKLIAHVAAED